jgi:hypothetical protein
MRVVTVRDVETSANLASIAVNGETTVYTKSFQIAYGDYFGVAYRAVATTGSPNITIQLEESWTEPSTEGSSDTNYVVPTGLSDIVTALTTQTWNIKTLSPIPMPYGRFKILGNATNGAAITVNIKLGIQEQF